MTLTLSDFLGMDITRESGRAELFIGTDEQGRQVRLLGFDVPAETPDLEVRELAYAYSLRLMACLSGRIDAL